jgi:type I site-specific restriction endonuclease
MNSSIVNQLVETILNSIASEVADKLKPTIDSSVRETQDRLGYDNFMEWIRNFISGETFAGRVMELAHDHLPQMVRVQLGEELREQIKAMVKDMDREEMNDWWENVTVMATEIHGLEDAIEEEVSRQIDKADLSDNETIEEIEGRLKDIDCAMDEIDLKKIERVIHELGEVKQSMTDLRARIDVLANALEANEKNQAEENRCVAGMLHTIIRHHNEVAMEMSKFIKI